MRSEALRTFLSQASDLNRNLTQALFVNEQFFIDHEAQLDGNPRTLTSEQFDDNPYREQFNWRLGELISERHALEAFLFKSTFVFLYSAFDAFTEELYVFTCTILHKQRHEGHDSWIGACFQTLGTTSEKKLESEVLSTLEYMRWRRNRLVHNDGSPSQDLRGLIKNKGTDLDRWWTGKLGSLKRLSFANEETKTFSQDELIDLIRVYREMANLIDSVVLDRLGTDLILEHLSREFKEHFGNQLKSWERSRRESKFRGYAKHHLGYTPDPEEVSGLDLGGA
jgi:hypothetical protein